MISRLTKGTVKDRPFTIVIVGRPNVGKSTLFNRLIGRRRSITDPFPGVTRDAVEEEFTVDNLHVLLIDTGGFKIEKEKLDRLVVAKSIESIKESDLILFLVDVNELNGEDYHFMELLRKYENKVILVANKADNEKREYQSMELYSLGFKKMIPVSAAHGRNIDKLRSAIVNAAVLTVETEKTETPPTEPETKIIRIAILGKPNTGKSTLLNYLLGEEKAIVSDIPGTTRDTINGYFKFKSSDFKVVDTAGIRKKNKVNNSVEYYSVNRAIKTISESDIVYLLIDAEEGLTDQDKKIASLVIKKGSGIILVLNKWDRIKKVKNQLQAVKDRVRFLFPILGFAPLVATTALDGEGVDNLLDVSLRVWRQLNRRIDTARLNDAVSKWVKEYPIPVRGKNIKLRYATQVEANPVKFIFFVNNKSGYPPRYSKYLENRIRRDLGFANVPVHLEIRQN
ncbi:MAG: ribosome biogenesis GTPase Der [Spirochaetes bacterium]|nr:MAG: ribosome biogenesis GTPase Der [Spirochaetota bacterium]